MKVSESNSMNYSTLKIPLSQCFDNIFSLELDVNTAASNNINSKKCFDKLQISLSRHGKEKSKSLPRGVKIKLADGSIADQECPVV